jgi:tetratricopeptide (TPR) repeat protein
MTTEGFAAPRHRREATGFATLRLSRSAGNRILKEETSSMAAVDPYAPCPCGSGEKFKWCCHKIESIADRAERLYEGRQIEAAIATLDDGLRKAPDNPWLLLRKVYYEIQLQRGTDPRALLERIFLKNPGHIEAHSINILLTLEREGLAAAVKSLQRALTAAAPEDRPRLADHIRALGEMLAEQGHIPAAIEHLSLALDWIEGDDAPVENSLQRVLGSFTVSPWLRNILELSPPPEGLSPAVHDRFEKAIAWAHEGLWSAAGTAFASMAAHGVPDADRNHGLCRLWLGDEVEALVSLRRHLATLDESVDAVDLEALCQDIETETEDAYVEVARLTWPLRDRVELQRILTSDPSIHFAGRIQDDEAEPESPRSDRFDVLDRPKPSPGSNFEKAADLPRVVARLFVADDTVSLETYDDGRLDAQRVRFVELGGPSIAPAQPKNEVMGKVLREDLVGLIDWHVPPKFDEALLRRLVLEERARQFQDVWPQTRLPFLKNRTPLEAAKAGNARVPLRAAVCRLEWKHEFPREGIDFAALRGRLGLPPEPAIDPQTEDVGDVHLSRLHRAPIQSLDDDALTRLFVRSDSTGMLLAAERSAEEIVRRGCLPDKKEINHVSIYIELATLALTRNDVAGGLEWMRVGRQSDPNAVQNAGRWEIEELRFRSRFEPPDLWAPRLSLVLGRVKHNSKETGYLTRVLFEMGLIRVVPDPNDSNRKILDPSPLQAFLARFGPRITTAAGELGISAAEGGIWTPDSGRERTSGALWTPGARQSPTPSEPSAGDKPKLIIPGR